MIGITSYGAYIPRYRIDRKVILEQTGWFNSGGGLAKGEKAMANYDEDSITMAVAAGGNALAGLGNKNLAGLSLATLSAPYANRQNAGIIADALALGDELRTADFSSSLRCGTTALLSALDSAAGGGAALVCASDARKAQPGSSQEFTFGDGAAAVAVGSENVAAEFMGSCSVSKDFQDYRRLADEPFERGWEERWIRDEGHAKLVPQAVRTLCGKYGLKIEDFAKIIVGIAAAGTQKALPKLLKAAPEQLEDTLLAGVGDTGSALPLLMLVKALESAKPGDNILVIGYGYGVDALWFRATDALPALQARCAGRSLEVQLARKKALPTYARYLAYKGLLQMELGIRGESVSPTAMSVVHRQGEAISSLEGVRCKSCGTVQYPKHAFCVECQKSGEMEPYSFLGRPGRIVTFTADFLAFSMDPPQHYGLIDFEGGGRLYLEYTDCVTEQLRVGDPVALTFRIKHEDRNRSVIQYGWKALPAAAEQGGALNA